MDMGMGGGGASSMAPLNDSGVDFSNETQAYNFLQEILDDTMLAPIGNQFARSFWYGIVVVVTIAAICHAVNVVILKSRQAFLSISDSN
jgi:ferric-chelate reductase